MEDFFEDEDPLPVRLGIVAIILVVGKSGWLLGGIFEITHIVPSWVASSLLTLFFKFVEKEQKKYVQQA